MKLGLSVVACRCMCLSLFVSGAMRLCVIVAVYGWDVVDCMCVCV